MTKKELEQKIKEILAKDKIFDSATIEVAYKNKDKKKSLANKTTHIVQ